MLVINLTPQTSPDRNQPNDIFMCPFILCMCTCAHTHNTHTHKYTHNTPTYQKEHIHLDGMPASHGTMCAFISKIRHNISYMLTFHLITHLFLAFESSSHIC